MVLQFPQRTDDVVLDERPPFAHAKKPQQMKARRLRFRLTRQPPRLALGERDELHKVPLVPRQQQRVTQHVSERRRHRHREAKRHAFFRKTKEHLHERQIGLRDRLEEPILFQKVLVLRVAHERQVRVEKKRQHGF